jgi:xanthine dehydrogenase accessory factor
MASAKDATDVLQSAANWLKESRGVALATVTTTWGSAPRQAGSQMAVREDGAFVGSVSGGCVEGAVIAEAQAALKDGKVRNLTFGVSDEQAWAVGLACGGTIAVHVEPIVSDAERDVVLKTQAAREGGKAIVMASALDAPESRLVFPDAQSADPLGSAAALAARHDKGETAEADGRNWFLTVFNPPLDLAIIGAVHIAQPLAAMAALTDYAVRVIDPRGAFATEARFPGVTLVNEWADEALATAPLGQRSALVALTHDPKLDDPGLLAALKSPAFYIGALGSKKTHARRLERLAAQGMSDQQLSRIRGPIGLSIGARTPAEIAISILGEMTQILRAG